MVTIEQARPQVVGDGGPRCQCQPSSRRARRQATRIELIPDIFTASLAAMVASGGLTDGLLGALAAYLIDGLE